MAPAWALLQRDDDLFQRVEREVDVLRLHQRLAVEAHLVHALAPREVHQVNLGASHRVAALQPALHLHGEYAVRARRRLVHGRLRDGLVGVAEEEEVQSLLLVVRSVRAHVAHRHVPFVVL